MKQKLTPGSIAYFVGIFGAMLLGILSAAGLFEYGVVFTTVLILAGIVIGLMNITRKETVPFMVASLVIASVSGILSQLEFVGYYFQQILGALALVIGPAAVVVAVMVAIKRGK